MPAPPKPARGRESDFLFIHLSLSGPADETADTARELVDALGKRFFAASGSVTSALRRAVLETNEQLLRSNLSGKSVREGALSCAVLHNHELYTLQVGEGLAFLGHNFGVERLPARAPQHLTPLGRSAGIDIRFAYHQLQTGDMMLLCDPRLSYLNGEALAPVLVDTEIESGLEGLLDVISGDSARLLLVEFADELPSTLPLTFQHSKRAPVKPATDKQTVSTARSNIAPSKPIQPLREDEIHNAVPVTTAELDPAVPTESSPVEDGVRRVASSSARGFSRFMAWLAEVLGRLLSKETDAPSVHWAIPSAIALIIPLVVGAVVTSVYIQRDTVNQVAQLKQEMMNELTAAENAGGNSEEAQASYLRVLSLASEVEQLRADDLEVGQMRSDALDALDRIDGVSRLTAEPFYRYSAGTNLSRIALRETGEGIAVLDQTSNRVLFHPTDSSYQTLTPEEPSIIGFGGQVVGSNTIGSLFDILWISGGTSVTRDSIGMVDTTGGLFNFFPNLGDINGVILGNSSEWSAPTAAATYLDRLYVLDTDEQQIWKYYGSSGYTQFEGDEALFFSADANLDQAIDFDLYSEDGSLVVLYRDGRIRYYDTRSGRIQWDETTLAQNGMSLPFIAPVAVKIVGSGLNASIFVLDPGSGRLVQLSRGGTVLTQYRVLDSAGNEILNTAADFAVADSPMRIFVVGENTLSVAGRD